MTSQIIERESACQVCGAGRRLDGSGDQVWVVCDSCLAEGYTADAGEDVRRAVSGPPEAAHAARAAYEFGPCHLCGSETPERHGTVLLGGECECGATSIEVCRPCRAALPVCRAVSGPPEGSLIFFDSHGAPWESCGPGEPGAVAFGPRGSARLRPDLASYAEAKSEGRVDDGDCGDFPVMIPSARERAEALFGPMATALGRLMDEHGGSVFGPDLEAAKAAQAAEWEAAWAACDPYERACARFLAGWPPADGEPAVRIPAGYVIRPGDWFYTRQGVGVVNETTPVCGHVRSDVFGVYYRGGLPSGA